MNITQINARVETLKSIRDRKSESPSQDARNLKEFVDGTISLIEDLSRSMRLSSYFERSSRLDDMKYRLASAVIREINTRLDFSNRDQASEALSLINTLSRFVKVPHYEGTNTVSAIFDQQLTATDESEARLQLQALSSYNIFSRNELSAYTGRIFALSNQFQDSKNPEVVKANLGALRNLMSDCLQEDAYKAYSQIKKIVAANTNNDPEFAGDIAMDLFMAAKFADKEYSSLADFEEQDTNPPLTEMILALTSQPQAAINVLGTLEFHYSLPGADMPLWVSNLIFSIADQHGKNGSRELNYEITRTLCTGAYNATGEQQQLAQDSALSYIRDSNLTTTQKVKCLVKLAKSEPAYEKAAEALRDTLKTRPGYRSYAVEEIRRETDWQNGNDLINRLKADEISQSALNSL